MLLIFLCYVICDKNELTQSMSQEAVNDIAITNKGVISSIKNYVKNLVGNVQVPAAKAKKLIHFQVIQLKPNLQLMI